MVPISTIYRVIDDYEHPIAGEFPAVNGVDGIVTLVFDGYTLSISYSHDDPPVLTIREYASAGSDLSVGERQLKARYAARQLQFRYPELLKDAVIDIDSPGAAQLPFEN